MEDYSDSTPGGGAESAPAPSAPSAPSESIGPDGMPPMSTDPGSQFGGFSSNPERMAQALDDNLAILEAFGMGPETPGYPEPERKVGQFDLNPERMRHLAENIKAERANLANAQQRQTTDAEVLGDFLTARNDGSDTEFLNRLYEHDYNTFESLVSKVLDLYGPTRENNSISSEELFNNGVPEHLYSTARSMRPDAWEELIMMPTVMRNHFLEREKERQVLQQKTAAYEAQMQEVSAAYAQTQGYQAAQAMSQDYERRHRQSIANWKPLGDDVAGNQNMHDVASNMALNEMSKNQTFEQMRQRALAALQEAPHRQVYGDEAGAQECEAEAQELARRWNNAYSTKLQEVVARYDKGFGERMKQNFRPKPPVGGRLGELSPQRLEQLAQELKQRMGTQFQLGPKPPFNRDGSLHASKEYLEWMAAQARLEKERQG